MILTKIQIINMLLNGLEMFENQEMKAKFQLKMQMKMLHMPEVDFQKFVKNDTNWNLEPIRKNTYIIN